MGIPKSNGEDDECWRVTMDYRHPEICSHPANCLMVRIGKRVDTDSIQADRLRFHNRFMY